MLQRSLEQACCSTHIQPLPQRSIPVYGQRSFRQSCWGSERRHTSRVFQRRMVLCAADVSVQQPGKRKKIVILGGTGRVGSSTAVSLLRTDPDYDIVVASRQRDSFKQAVKKRPKLAGAQYEQVKFWLHKVRAFHRGVMCRSEILLYMCDPEW